MTFEAIHLDEQLFNNVFELIEGQVVVIWRNSAENLRDLQFRDWDQEVNAKANEFH